MSKHVIVGAGAVGSATASVLAERGDQVSVISRRGTGPEHPAIEGWQPTRPTPNG